MTERLHFHFSLSCIGEGDGNPLQCSCLENPRDGGAWWAAVYGVAQSRTRLKRLSSSSSSSMHVCISALSYFIHEMNDERAPPLQRRQLGNSQLGFQSFTAVAWVQSLVRELRSHKLLSTHSPQKKITIEVKLRHRAEVTCLNVQHVQQGFKRRSSCLEHIFFLKWEKCLIFNPI